jgi:hypothetical protein
MPGSSRVNDATTVRVLILGHVRRHSRFSQFAYEVLCAKQPETVQQADSKTNERGFSPFIGERLEWKRAKRISKCADTQSSCIASSEKRSRVC